MKFGLDKDKSSNIQNCDRNKNVLVLIRETDVSMFVFIPMPLQNQAAHAKYGVYKTSFTVTCFSAPD